jgi:hypothetical protein
MFGAYYLKKVELNGKLFIMKVAKCKPRRNLTSIHYNSTDSQNATEAKYKSGKFLETYNKTPNIKTFKEIKLKSFLGA